MLAAVGLLAWRGVLTADRVRSSVGLNRVHLYGETLFFEWLVFALVIAGVRKSGTSVYTVLGERWRSVGQVMRDIGIGLAFWILSTGLLSLVGPHLHDAATSQRVAFLLPQGAMETLLWAVLSVSAGICEETVYRGYLQRQFTALTKHAPVGILLSALAFGGVHLYQGLGGAIPIAVQGAMLGALAHWRRSVRPGMISHSWQDLFVGVLARSLKIKIV